ncbi:MAG: DUF6456 domain-containing protein [Pseudomonadota bacterium]
MATQDTAEWLALSAIANGKCHIATGDGPGTACLADADGGRHRTTPAVLRLLARKALVQRDHDRLVLSDAGRALVRRRRSETDPFRAQHQELDLMEVETPDGRATALVNLAESPLGQLMRRRTRDGQTFLTRHEFEAGERLRGDYARAQIMPRLGANWEQPIATGRRGGAAADLSDGAIAARMRVERAIDAVGPELSGVLIDVCCFLKGLETVESERGWPVRSAKLMLKTALGALSRHYEPPGAERRRSQIFAWGGEGYRPSISG